MNIDEKIDELVNKLTAEHFSVERIAKYCLFLKLVKKEIISANLGVEVFEQHCSVVADRNESTYEFTYDIDNEALGFTDVEFSTVELTILDEELKEISDLIGESQEKAKANVKESMIEGLVQAWRDAAPDLLQKERENLSQFRSVLWESWGETLDLLDIVLGTTLEKGEELKKLPVHKDDGILYIAVHALFGRSCQVSREISVLLSNGLADGAEARWRTLFELVATTTFIMQHGSDVAERYLQHEKVDMYRTMKKYEAWKSEGIEIFSTDQASEIEKDFQNVEKKYGKEFTSDYGWAAKALGMKRPTFADIEKAVEHDYLRPLYKEANSNIHASARGTTIRLGLPGGDRILVGHSVFGIGEVARNTAISMLILMENLLTLYSDSLENLVHAEALYKFLDLISEAAQAARNSLGDPSYPEDDLSGATT